MKDFAYTVLIRATWLHVGAFRKKYVTAMGLLIVSQAIFLFGPYIMGQFFNVIQQGLKTDEQLHKAILLLVLNFALQPITWAMHGPGRLIERRCGFFARQNFVQSCYAKLRSLPYAWHQNFHTGQLYDRLRKAEEALEDFTSNQFRYIIFVMNFIGPVIALIFLFKWFGVACLVLACFAVILIVSFDKKLIPLYERNNKLTHDYAGVFSDYLGNIRTIIALRLGGETEKELLHRYEARQEPQWKEYRINEFKWCTIDHTAEFFVTVFIIVALYLVKGDAGLKIGNLVMLIQYLNRFSGTFYGMGEIYQNMVKSATNFGSAKMIDDAYQKHVLNKPEQTFDKISDQWKHISVQGLGFKYEDSDHRPHAIKDVCLDMRSGEKIAFVGTSGAGKSTLMTLLRGLYEADKGYVVIDGKEYSSLAPLADMTTLIPQDPEIFENTIRYNITFGVTHSEDEIKEACSIACFEEVLALLPQGLESDVREKGVNLSGGQKQRLALARGVFAIQKSSLILMDEPTSSVDTLTEMRIFDRLFTEFADKTIIASVHRLHLLSRFDRIVMINNGQIIEEGSLQKLIRQQGVFATLWNEYQEQQAENDRDE